MATKRIKKLVAIVGKRQTSEGEKPIYQTVGSMFKNDEGKISLKIDCMPVGCPDWNGWVNVYDLDGERINQQQAPQQRQPQQAPVDFDNGGEDIPFFNPYKHIEYLV